MACSKVMRFPLSYIDGQGIDYRDFLTEYFEIQKQIREIKNRVSIDFYLKKEDDRRIQKETGSWPKWSLQKWTNEEYHALKPTAPLYNTANLSQLLQSQTAQLKAHYAEVFKGERTIDTYKSDQPVVIKGDAIRLENLGNETIAVMSVFSSAIKERYPVKNGLIRFKVDVRSGTMRSIADRCVLGIYKTSASALGYDRKKKRFMLALTYTFEREEPNAKDPCKVLGIDLGVSTAYYAATNFSKERFYDPGGDIEAFRQKTEKERNSRRRQRAFCGDGSIGHGYETRVRPVLAVGDKIARYRDHKNHLMARHIVDRANKIGCGTIQMEDLSGINEENVWLKNWSYYDLQQKIKSKAAEKGISVVTIDPKFTSQRCSECGCIDERNRPKIPTWAVFRCVNCGYETNADYNAARNIATPGIENIIASSCANVKRA